MATLNDKIILTKSVFNDDYKIIKKSSDLWIVTHNDCVMDEFNRECAEYLIEEHNKKGCINW